MCKLKKVVLSKLGKNVIICIQFISIITTFLTGIKRNTNIFQYI